MQDFKEFNHDILMLYNDKCYPFIDDPRETHKAFAVNQYWHLVYGVNEYINEINTPTFEMIELKEFLAQSPMAKHSAEWATNIISKESEKWKKNYEKNNTI